MKSLGPGATLVLVDMQNGLGSPEFGRRNNPTAELSMAALLDAWRRTDRPVVHVRHLSLRADSVFRPGQPGALFLERMAPRTSEHVVEKNVPDAFVRTGLERWLRQHSVQELVVAGATTNNAIEATCRTAGCLGFSTYLPADACFTFDAVDFRGTARTAEEVHAMSLANLRGEYVTVTATVEVLWALDEIKRYHEARWKRRRLQQEAPVSWRSARHGEASR